MTVRRASEPTNPSLQTPEKIAEALRYYRMYSEDYTDLQHQDEARSPRSMAHHHRPNSSHHRPDSAQIGRHFEFRRSEPVVSMTSCDGDEDVSLNRDTSSAIPLNRDTKPLRSEARLPKREEESIKTENKSPKSEPPKCETESLKCEAEQLKSVAEPLKCEAEHLKSVAEPLKCEAEPLKSEDIKADVAVVESPRTKDQNGTRIVDIFKPVPHAAATTEQQQLNKKNNRIERPLVAAEQFTSKSVSDSDKRCCSTCSIL